MIFWFIGWLFTMGFVKTESSVDVIIIFLIWPIKLGDELREYLDKGE